MGVDIGRRRFTYANVLVTLLAFIGLALAWAGSVQASTSPGLFEPATRLGINAGSHVHEVEIGSFNASVDDRPDLAVGGLSFVCVSTQTAARTFGPDCVLEANYIPLPGNLGHLIDIESADLDGDGDLDLVILQGGGGETSGVTIAMQAPKGSWAERSSSFEVTGVGGGIASGDFNGDGRTDLVVGGSPHVQILHQTAGGAFIPTNQGRQCTPYMLAPSGGFEWCRFAGVAVGDLNGDGRLDIVATDTFGKNVELLHNTPSGFIASSVPVGDRPYDVVLANLAGSDQLDIATATGSDRGDYNYPNGGGGHPEVSLLRQTPDNAFELRRYVAPALQTPQGRSVPEWDDLKVAPFGGDHAGLVASAGFLSRGKSVAALVPVQGGLEFENYYPAPGVAAVDSGLVDADLVADVIYSDAGDREGVPNASPTAAAMFGRLAILPPFILDRSLVSRGRGPGAARLPLTCPEISPCIGRLVLAVTRGSHKPCPAKQLGKCLQIGGGQFSLKAGQRARVKLALNERAEDLLDDEQRLKGRLVVRVRDEDGQSEIEHAKVTLKERNKG